MPRKIRTDIFIIGAGPGGLACAKLLAEQGRQVLVLERQEEVGPKVCAGGVTWNGLLQLIPKELMEGSFCKQYLFTPFQRTVIQKKDPIIATVNRKVLGQQMAEAAQRAGAKILTGVRATAIDGLQVTAVQYGEKIEIKCSQLVGADGAHSLVRRSLGIPATERGIGINFQVPECYERMEWHMDAKAFSSGYAWIFPHRDSVSIGVYSPSADISARRLKRNFLNWAASRGFQLGTLPCQAGCINYDYRGYAFDRIWLVGDAAGLTSGLTGEGIYPAIVSGETVGRRILDPSYEDKELSRIIRKHWQHSRSARFSRQRPVCSSLAMELILFLFRFRLLRFQAMEMV
jgi:geranylgeranyl reductase